MPHILFSHGIQQKSYLMDLEMTNELIALHYCMKAQHLVNKEKVNSKMEQESIIF